MILSLLIKYLILKWQYHFRAHIFILTMKNGAKERRMDLHLNTGILKIETWTDGEHSPYRHFYSSSETIMKRLCLSECSTLKPEESMAAWLLFMHWFLNCLCVLTASHNRPICQAFSLVFVVLKLVLFKQVQKKGWKLHCRNIGLVYGQWLCMKRCIQANEIKCSFTFTSSTFDSLSLTLWVFIFYFVHFLFIFELFILKLWN